MTKKLPVIRSVKFDLQAVIISSFFITHDVEEALLLASRIIVLSKHPGKVIGDFSVNFSEQIIKDANSDIKFSQEFYKYREKLLKLINVQ